ncbi:PBIP1 protein, partial [Podargus strigoides]|nr:PBIP1 protein [Podargus strigoides]
SPAVTANGAAAFPGQTRHRCPQDPEQHLEPEAVAVPTPGGPAEPGVTEGGEPEEPDAETVLGPCPDTPIAGPPTEESCTSSDNDVEGLRRRQGHQPCPTPPRPAPAPHRRTADGGAEDGLGVSTYLLGALALVAVALLIVTNPVESAVSRDAVAGEQEPPPPADGNDSQQDPRVSDPGDPQSLTSVTLLLDKLAKENQEIRLMQAELQAHKEELQALLRKSEGEAVAAGAQQQSLAAENARLRAALERD